VTEPARYVSTVQFASAATEHEVFFGLPESEDRHADDVRVWLDLRHDRAPIPMHRERGGWSVTLPRPPVQRLEYLFVLHHGADESVLLDPGNPRRTTTPDGGHSVLEFPGYRAPAWLEADDPPQPQFAFDARSRPGRPTVGVRICAPPDSEPEQPLPLLVVHDGPAYDELAQLRRFSAALTESGRLPRHRVALLAPGDRDDDYSARPEYAWTVHDVVLPQIAQRVGLRGRPVFAGASLGALAALHLALWRPGTVAGLFLQSGSFFDPLLDAQERGFAHFTRVSDFVSSVPTSTGPLIEIGLTCGRAEENLANNRRMAELLADRGHDVELDEVADAHTFTGWRDALDPHLVDLLTRTWDTS
jgi:enterochelin esterase family protein